MWASIAAIIAVLLLPRVVSPLYEFRVRSRSVE
jgi:hypothetical protein